MSIFDLFKKIEEQRGQTAGKPEWIIVGLGNPGKKYDTTRHNTGFIMLDTLSGILKADVKDVKFHGLSGRATVGQTSVLLLKPQTFMNLSGECVSAAAAFYKIPMNRVIVVYDDVSLPIGKIRIREKGSAGGHNGIKNIIERTGTDVFPRIKIGVGAPPRAEYDLVDWVLGAFSDEEKKAIAPAIDNSCKAVSEIIENGAASAAAKYN